MPAPDAPAPAPPAPVPPAPVPPAPANPVRGVYGEEFFEIERAPRAAAPPLPPPLPPVAAPATQLRGNRPIQRGVLTNPTIVSTTTADDFRSAVAAIGVVPPPSPPGRDAPNGEGGNAPARDINADARANIGNGAIEYNPMLRYPHGGLPGNEAEAVYRDPILVPRTATQDALTRYRNALADVNADVVKRFAKHVTAGFMQEHKAFIADEYLLQALYSKRHDEEGAPNFPRGERRQTPWWFFMEYGSNDVSTAMRKGWDAFVGDATARRMQGRENDVLEHDEWWQVYAEYVRAELRELKQHAPWQHPTLAQMATQSKRDTIDLNLRRIRMQKMGLRGGGAGGDGGVGVRHFLY